MNGRQRARDSRGEDDLEQRLDPSSNAHASSGHVVGVDDDLVTVVLTGWGTRQKFGPVRWAAAAGLLPDPGDGCVLHFTADREPLYAVVWGSGAPIGG